MKPLRSRARAASTPGASPGEPPPAIIPRQLYLPYTPLSTK